jgi:hypothetical protein
MKLIITAVFLTSALTVITPLSGQTEDSPTGLKGVITSSPAHPGPTREGIPNSAPLANCPLTAKTETGTPISFTTDSEGRFKVSLPAGHYTIALSERRARRCGPFEVDVVSGKMTAVEWRCDSGMR